VAHEKRGESAQPTTGRPASKRRRPVAIALRVGLIAIIVLAMVGLGHVLRNPAGFGEEEEEGAIADRAAPDAGWPPEVDFSGGPPPPDARPTTEQEADDDLRHVMAGLIMAALDGEDEEAGREPTPTEQQRRVADLFGLPYDYPHSQAPADLVPAEAEVLMVFDNPERPGCRMVLVRMRGDVDEALEAFYRHYESMDWEGEDLRKRSPREYGNAQPDRGWLVRFSQARDGRIVRRRVVYARPRATGEETLVAIYDPNDAGN